MKRFLLCSVLIGFAMPLFAQAPSSETARELLDFLSKGDLVGVQSVDGTGSVVVSVYSESEFNLAKAIAKLGRRTANAATFAEGNGALKKRLQKYVESHDDSEISMDEVMLIPLTRMSLGKVIAIGRDYVLVNFEGSTNQRCVISRSSISKLYLDASPVRFYGPRRSASR